MLVDLVVGQRDIVSVVVERVPKVDIDCYYCDRVHP